MDEEEDVIRVEEFDVFHREEIIDIKDNLINTDEARDIDYSCKQCDYTTTVMESLTQHIKSKHQALSTVKYDNLKNSKDLQQKKKISVTNDVSTINDFQGLELGVYGEIDYLEQIQSYSGEMYSCDQCDFNTGTTKILYRHKRTKHEDGGVVYNCDKCDYSANCSYNLDRYKNIKHEGIR